MKEFEKAVRAAWIAPEDLDDQLRYARDDREMKRSSTGVFFQTISFTGFC